MGAIQQILSSYKNATTTNGLLTSLFSYHTLDNTLNDSTANANTLTNSGATYNATGKVNGGYDFASASSNYMYAANNASYNNKIFTIQAWVKTTTTGQQWIVDKEWNSDYRKYGIGLNMYWTGGTTASLTNAICFWIGTAGGWQANVYGTTTTLTDGNWHHIVATYNNGVTKIYFDGSSIYSATLSNDMPASNTAPFNIGSAYSGGRAGYFNGTLDEIGFWTRDLSSADVTALYNGGVGLGYSSFN